MSVDLPGSLSPPLPYRDSATSMPMTKESSTLNGKKLLTI